MTSAPICVRPMQATDLVGVLQLANALPEAPHWPLEAYQAAVDPSASPRRHALVAERAGELLGFAVVAEIADEAELESIAVAASQQRQGVGRLLLAQLTQTAQSRNISRLLLEVRASNHKAIGFYHVAGWVQCGLRKRYYADPEEDALLLELPLRHPARHPVL